MGGVTAPSLTPMPAYTRTVTGTLSRLATWAIALLIGAVYGIAGTISHAYALGWLPLGLILAILGSAALLVAVRALTLDRWATLATGLGMTLAVLLFSGPGPGGSVVVPQSSDGAVNAGLVWTIAVPVLVAIVVSWPDTRSARDARTN